MPSEDTSMAPGTSEENANKVEGDNQLLDVCSEFAIVTEVPSSNVATTAIVSVVPATPLRVLDVPISFLMDNAVMFTGVSVTSMSKDAFRPPKLPTTRTEPTPAGIKFRELNEADGEDSLRTNDTRL